MFLREKWSREEQEKTISIILEDLAPYSEVFVGLLQIWELSPKHSDELLDTCRKAVDYLYTTWNEDMKAVIDQTFAKQKQYIEELHTKEQQETSTENADQILQDL